MAVTNTEELMIKQKENQDRIKDIKTETSANKKQKSANKKASAEDVLSAEEIENAKKSVSPTYNVYGAEKQKTAKQIEREQNAAVEKARKNKVTKLNYEIDAKNQELKDEKSNLKNENRNLGEQIFQGATENMKQKGGYLIGNEDKEAQKLYKENLEQTKADVKDLKNTMDVTKDEIIKTSEADTEKQMESLKAILDKVEKGDLSYSVKDLPMGIIRRAKRGDFGKFNIDEDVKKAYMAEMRKPAKERDQKVIDAYNKEKESTKDARSVMGNFILNALFTGLSNAGNVLQGKAPTEKSAYQKYSESKLQGSLDRYNKLWQDASEEMQNSIKAKGIIDRETSKQIADLYKNAAFRPYLDRLDTDSLERTILLAKNIGGKVDLGTFKNALLMQMLQDPQGAISGGLKTAIDLIPGGGIIPDGKK